MRKEMIYNCKTKETTFKEREYTKQELLDGEAQKKIIQEHEEKQKFLKEKEDKEFKAWKKEKNK